MTAQRRAERARDVPISITAIDAAQIKQANVQQLSDVTKLTPALRFDYAGAFAQPTIRGVGTAVTVSGGGSNVGIYVDGFYSPNPLAADFQLMNVENIQVLKGPQGTLFGRNTTGGAIVVTTAQPSTTPEAIFESSYGSFNAIKSQAYVTGGIGDNVAVDAELRYTNGDGFARNILTHQSDPGAYRDWEGRIGLKATLSDTASILLRYSHEGTSDPTEVETNVYVQNGRPLTAAFNFGGLFGTPTIATSPGDLANPDPAFFHSRSDAVQITGKIDLGFADLTSYSQYRRDTSTSTTDADHSSLPLFYGVIPVTDTTITQEFLVTSKPGPKLQWTAGAFYLNYKDIFDPSAATIFGATYPTFAASGTTTRTIAAYLDLTYQLGERIFLTAGGRFSHDTVGDAYFARAGASGALEYTAAPSITDNKATWRAVARYKPSDQSSLYASYTRGFKPGVVNVGGATLDGILVKPETISAYEVGYKYGARRLTIDLAGYYYDYKNLQVASYNGSQSLINNAATAHIYGFEGSFGYRIGKAFDVSGGAAYTHARYGKYQDSAYFDFTTSGPFNLGQSDASGLPMQRAPTFTANLSARYTVSLAQGRLALSGNYYHTSTIYFDSSNQFSQSAYDTLGLRAEWTDPSQHLTLAVYGDNVTGARYRTQVLSSIFGVGNVWSPPATFGGSIRFRFGGSPGGTR